MCTFIGLLLEQPAYKLKILEAFMMSMKKHYSVPKTRLLEKGDIVGYYIAAMGKNYYEVSLALVAGSLQGKWQFEALDGMLRFSSLTSKEFMSMITPDGEVEIIGPVFNPGLVKMVIRKCPFVYPKVESMPRAIFDVSYFKGWYSQPICTWNVDIAFVEGAREGQGAFAALFAETLSRDKVSTLGFSYPLIFQIALTCFSRVCTRSFDENNWGYDLPLSRFADMYPSVQLSYVALHGLSDRLKYKEKGVEYAAPMVKFHDVTIAFRVTPSLVGSMCYSADVKRFVTSYMDLDLQHFLSLDLSHVTTLLEDYDFVVIARNYCRLVSLYGFKSIAPSDMLKVVKGIGLYKAWRSCECVCSLKSLRSLAVNRYYFNKLVPMIGRFPLRALSFVLKEYDDLAEMIFALEKYGSMNDDPLLFDTFDDGFDAYINNLFDEVTSLPEFVSWSFDRGRILKHFTGFFYEYIWLLVPFFFRILTYRLGL